MSPGEVIREAWTLYKAHWRHLLPIAFVFYVILGLVTLALASVLGLLGVLVGALVSLVGVFWLQGALTEAVADIRDGRADLSIGDTFRRVRPRVFTLLGAGLLAGLGVLVGLLLLIVPGLYLLTIWSVIVPVIVLENRSVMESFGRSRELVRGNGWNVFGVIVLSFLVLLVAGIAIGLLLSFLPDEIATYASDVVSNTLTAPFVALAWTLVYYHLVGREPTAQASTASPFAQQPGG